MENSPVGASRANGARERAVQAIAEQVRVIRRGLEQRLELRLSGHGMAGGAFAVDLVALRRAPPVACKDPSRQSECSPGSFVIGVQLTCFE